MNFEKLNLVGQQSYLPKKKLADLEINKKFKITKVKQVNTKFGNKVYVELEDSFGVFLPSRVSKFIEKCQDEWDAMIKESETGNLYLQYPGGYINMIQFGNFQEG